MRLISSRRASFFSAVSSASTRVELLASPLASPVDALEPSREEDQQGQRHQKAAAPVGGSTLPFAASTPFATCFRRRLRRFGFRCPRVDPGLPSQNSRPAGGATRL